MAKINTVEEDTYFVYSDMHANKEKEVASKVGKTYVYGTVANGTKMVKFTEMVTESNLRKYEEMYPDVQVVVMGNKNQITYTKPGFGSIR